MALPALVSPLVGIPGAPELLILLLVSILIFGIPILVVAAAAALLYRSRGNEEELRDRVRDLEREIDELRDRLDGPR